MPIGPFEALIILVVIGVTIIPYWIIIKKTGYHGALALLFFVPIANFILPFFLAFSKWPIERRLDDLERKSVN